MKKVVLILMLGMFSLSMSSFKANSLKINPEPYDPCVGVYVDTWLNVYLDTLDMEAADAAAWDAENACQDIVTAGDWLSSQ
jgi:hypothetical protein